MSATPPRRRHVFKLEIGADSVRHIADLLETLADEIDREQLPLTGSVTSLARGYSWSHSIDPSITHESYERALFAWREAERARKTDAEVLSLEPEPLSVADALMLLVATFTDRMPTGAHVRSTWWRTEEIEEIAAVAKGAQS